MFASLKPGKVGQKKGTWMVYLRRKVLKMGAGNFRTKTAAHKEWNQSRKKKREKKTAVCVCRLHSWQGGGGSRKMNP